MATLIREKQVTSREVVQAQLDRIAEVNGAVNAVTVVLADEALATRQPRRRRRRNQLSAR